MDSWTAWIHKNIYLLFFRLDLPGNQQNNQTFPSRPVLEHHDGLLERWSRFCLRSGQRSPSFHRSSKWWFWHASTGKIMSRHHTVFNHARLFWPDDFSSGELKGYLTGLATLPSQGGSCHPPHQKIHPPFSMFSAKGENLSPGQQRSYQGRAGRETNS